MKYLLGILLIIGLISCKEKKGYVSKEENGGDEVITIEGGDTDMNQAIQNARSKYAGFLEVFKKDNSESSGYSVKLGFDYEGGREHMWLYNLYFVNQELYGILDSDPMHVKSLKAGDSLKVDEKELSDWMYIRDSKLQGGYTIKVLYDKMTNEEKRQFLQEVQFEID